MSYALAVLERNINIVMELPETMLLELYENTSTRINSALNKQIFFVVGAPKSGTTWLQKLLDSHPEIACYGEGHFHRLIDMMGQLVKQHNSGQETVNTYVYENSPYYRLVSDAEFDYLVTTFIGLMFSQRKIDNNIRFVGDKTPLHVMHMHTLRTAFPTAKFIHIVRDGRDAAISITRHSDRMLNRITLPGQPLFYQCIKEAAERWHGSIQAALQFQQQFPHQYHQVRYFELKQAPKEAMEGILSFLGASQDDEMIAQIYKANTFEALSGGRKAGQENISSFYRKGIVGDWKNHFDNKSLEIFNQIAQTSLEAMGYPVVTEMELSDPA